MKVRALVVLAALILSACNQEEPPPQPGSFDRPTRVAFVCFETDPDSTTNLAKPVTLTRCAINPGVVVEEPLLSLHALVVQSSRGEVAAVDLRPPGKVLDSRADIPSYTFLPVGELPVAIAVPTREENAKETYVLNAGSRDISVLKTATFRVRAALEIPTLQTVPLPGGSRDVPQDMVLSPDEDALFVSMPNTGRLLRLPIIRCGAKCLEDGTIDPDGITEFPLARSLDLAVASPGGDVDHDLYAHTCSYSQPIPNTTLPVAVPPADSPAPHPGNMALDDFCETDKPCKRRLLVSDSALPLIHVIDLEELAASGEEAAVQAPILTGTPTLSVAVTPRVPTVIGPDAGETQYVYAIDATDGSLLVTENGKLLEVGATGARKDRITLGLGVTLPHLLSMSVMTPAFDVHGPAAQYTQEPPGTKLEEPSKTTNWCVDTFGPVYSTARLRGVFLAVGATDGSLRMIDVHDMDAAECRPCGPYKEGCVCNPQDDEEKHTNKCDACQATAWSPYPLVRHRERIIEAANPQIPTPTLAPVAQPVFASGGVQTAVRTTGTTSDPNIKGLWCTPCKDGQQAAYPADGTAVPGAKPEAPLVDLDGDIAQACEGGYSRVCALADPWTEVDDWRATYKGALPGSQGGQGKFDKLDQDTPEFSGEIRFCGSGVLGADQLAGRAGDQLSILGALAPDDIIRKTEPGGDESFQDKTIELCKELIDRRDSSEDQVPIAFEIRAAYTDRLELAPTLTSRPVGIDTDFHTDVQLINKCFGNKLLSYEVRSGSSYVVVGFKKAGFEHRVKAADGTGHCETDTSVDPRRDGRAYEDQPFNNGRLTFQIADSNGATKLGTTFAPFLSTVTTDKAEVNLSVSVNSQVTASVPVDIRWSAGGYQLFVVDVSYRGLLPVQVSPFNPNVVGGSFD
ncbi:MAG TPA: hypothetical protein VJV78_45570 [Polyangiales bacterium]|nr:hypothetical protein [Polyangiales bacterium]